MSQMMFWIKQYLLGFALLAFSILFGIFIVGYLSLKNQLTATEQAEQVAKAYGNLVTTSQVDRYAGQAAYYTVYGQDQEGQDLLVSINQKSGQVLITQSASGITRDLAQDKARTHGATQLDRTVFGIYQDRPIWEVKSGTAYYLIDFVTGDLVKKEGL